MGYNQNDIKAVIRPINLVSHAITEIQKYWLQFLILLTVFVAIGVSMGQAFDPVRTMQYKLRWQSGTYIYKFEKITIPNYWLSLIPSNFSNVPQRHRALSTKFAPKTLFSDTMANLNNMISTKNYGTRSIKKPIVSLQEKKRIDTFIFHIGGRVSTEELRKLANNMISTATEMTRRLTNARAKSSKIDIIDMLETEYKLRKKTIAGAKEHEKYQVELAALNSHIKFLTNSQDQIEFNPVRITSNIELKSSKLLRWANIIIASLMLALLAIFAFIAALYIQRQFRKSARL